MATTEVPTYPNHVPALTQEHVDTLKDWLTSAMGDEDKATDPDDCSFYEGQATAYRSVLSLLYGIAPDAAG